MNSIKRSLKKKKASSHLTIDKKIHTHSFIRWTRSWRFQQALRKKGFLIGAILITICITLYKDHNNTFCLSPCKTMMPQRHPRVIQFNERYEIECGRNYDHSKYREVELLTEVVHIKQDHSSSPFEEGNCKAMHIWQVENNQACNSIHETDLLQIKHLAKGGFRDVWWMRDGDGSDAVIKTLVWKKKFRIREKDRHQRDANAFSALQSSTSIPNIYGYCTNTAIFDYCAEGTIDDMLEDDDQKFMSTWTPKHVLRYAWQISKALADVHSVGNIHNSAAIAHTDVSPDQFLWIDGMFKLNDFNRARFLRWDDVEKRPCPFYISVNKGRHRSPEEYIDDHPLTEKIDVFALGNVLYSILTRRDVYENMDDIEEIQENVRAGIFVTFPKKSIEKFSEMEKAVVQAIEMCLVKDVEERKTAMDVERYLREKLEEYGVSKF